MKLSTTQKRILAGLCPRCASPNTASTHYCSDCKEWNRLRAQERRKTRLDMCTRCLARPPEGDRTYCQPCQQSSRLASKTYRENLKAEVFTQYGGACACCGVANLRLLQLDHVNNDGSTHRAEVGEPMLRWAHKNQYPPTLQLLCANCHHVKTVYGSCQPEDHSAS